MNKCIIFAVLAFAACVAAFPNPKPGLGAWGVPSLYGAPVYAQPIASLNIPSAAAAAAAAASVPTTGQVLQVPSYSILGGNPGYGLGPSLGIY